MNPPKQCSKCGTVLPPDAPAGVCPKCLLQAGMEGLADVSVDEATLITNPELNVNRSNEPATERDAPQLPQAPPVGSTLRYFGDYELLEEIARGGMGVVYKARQVRLNRIVALKMILAGQFAGPADVQRFQTEAEAAAQLSHPGIVPIFEVGEYDGHHFFSMGLVAGDSLARRIADGPLVPKEAAEIVRSIAVAVQYAHDKGVIHRDLKPANILLDNDSQPHVTDFGLAKKVKGDSQLTATGQILGTPSYMPPEQAAGRLSEVRETADIYSLGAILYATLTGRPPFQADNPLDTLMQVLEREPVAPRILNAKVPADLETICLKCLSKDRRHRCQTAAELRDELQRYLDGRPILARPISRIARAWRWCKRSPVLAGLLATAAALFLTLSVGGWLVASRETANAREQAQLRRHADDERTRAEENERVAQQNFRIAERNAYNSEMLLVQREWDDGNTGLARVLLDRRHDGNALRRFEWNYWNRLAHSDLLTLKAHPDNYVYDVAFSPDGSRLVTASSDKTVTVWSAVTGQEILVFRGHDDQVRDVAFSPDGTRLASISMGAEFGGATIKVWDADTGQETLTIRMPNKGSSVVFSPNGKRLASEGADNTVKVWDAATGLELLTLKGHTDSVGCVAFSPDGMRIASAGRDLTIRIWDAATGGETLTLKGHMNLIQSVVFSPDAARVASAGDDGAVKVWDVISGEAMLTLNAHPDNYVYSVAFSPDGTRLATAGRDKMVKVWDADTGQQQLTLEGHNYAVFCVVFSPDGKRLASASGINETVKVWDALKGQETLTLKGHTYSVTSVAFSPDGRQLASAGVDKTVRIWDVASGQAIHTLKGHTSTVTSVAFSPEGTRIASASYDRTVKLWDAKTGEEVHTLKGHALQVNSVAFSPDGRWLASGSGDFQQGALKVWDVSSGKELLTFKGYADQVNAVAFNADGTRLASAGGFLNKAVDVRVWDSATGDPLLTLKGLDFEVKTVAFSRDGTRLAAAGGGAVKVWDMATGQVTLTLHTSPVLCVAFSPDGDLLASAADKTVKVWDAATGQDTLTLKGHTGPVSSVAFSPDGTRLASASHDGTVKVWDARPLETD